MSNIVTIESKPATGASAAPPQIPALLPSAAQGQGLQVTDNAIKRIRIAMAKEGVSPGKVVSAWAMGGGCSGLSYSTARLHSPRADCIYDL